jgi:hypothetical protein
MIKTAATDQALWAVARTTPEMRQFPPLQGFETATLVGRQEGQSFSLHLTAEGSDAKKVELSMQDLNRALKSSREWFDANAPVMPPLKPVRNFLRSITPTVQGTKVTATATYRGPLTETLVFLEYPYATANPVEDDKPQEARPASGADRREPAGKR